MENWQHFTYIDTVEEDGVLKARFNFSIIDYEYAMPYAVEPNSDVIADDNYAPLRVYENGSRVDGKYFSIEQGMEIDESTSTFTGVMKIFPLTEGQTYTVACVDRSYEEGITVTFTASTNSYTKAKDLVSGVLAESITASTTNVLVNIAENIGRPGIMSFFPTPPFYITIMPKSPAIGVANRLDSEILQVTAVGNDQVGNAALTCVRGQRDTTAKAFEAGSIVTVGIYTDDAVFLDETGTEETEEPWVDTNSIIDGAVTRDKLDATTNMVVRKLDEINAATIPYKTSGNGLLVDIRKYFANNSTAANRPMVFDEILFKFDISVTDTTVIHYVRFGSNDGPGNIVVRNMLSIEESGVSGSHAETNNTIIGVRLGSNTEVRILPFGGTERIPTLADNLTLVTLTDNSSVNFTSSGTRINFNTLYRLQHTSNKLSMFQNDLNQTLFNGVIKVYGIKYPTA